MNKRYCIFDMDGTLTDSMGFWRALGREYLAAQGVTGEVKHVLERIKALTMQEAGQIFIDEFGIAGPAERVADDINAMMDTHYRTDVPLKEGAREYVERLHESGAKLCVVTATAETMAHACLSRLGVDGLLDFIISCETGGAGKDKPDVFLEAAQRLGAEPGDIAVFEDSLYAARTAKNAGFHVVGVYDSTGDNEWDSIKGLADELITDWREA